MPLSVSETFCTSDAVDSLKIRVKRRGVVGEAEEKGKCHGWDGARKVSLSVRSSLPWFKV